MSIASGLSRSSNAKILGSRVEQRVPWVSQGVGLESTSNDNQPGASGSPPTAVAHVDAFFPCVHGHDTGELVRLQAFVAPSLKATIKITSPAIDDTAAQQVVGASRFAERDGKSALGVIASVSNPSFSGNSYQLTLAITDKLARYGWVRAAVPLIATGRLPTDGCGRVERIDALETKLRLILREAPDDSIFVFPTDNRERLSAAEKALLEQIEERGITCQAIGHIDELEGHLWNAPPSTATPASAPAVDDMARAEERPSIRTKPKYGAGHLLLIALALVGAVLAWTFLSAKNPAGLPEGTRIPVQAAAAEGKDAKVAPTIIEQVAPEAGSADERPATTRPLESGFINTDAY